jgi:hypothetical protein
LLKIEKSNRKNPKGYNQLKSIVFTFPLKKVSKMAKKIIHNKELSDQKKVFRTPTPKPTKWFKDKSKYNRKSKHKDLGNE